MMRVMGRPRKKQSILPPCMYAKHGAYWYVKGGKWTRLSDDLHTALVMHADLAAATAKATSSGKMVQLIEEAMPHILAGKSANTIDQYMTVKKKLLQVFRDVEPRDLLPRHILECQMAWAATPNMANRRLSVLRQIFKYGMIKNFVDFNPCAGVKRLDEVKRARYITDDEYARIWKEASADARVMIDLQYLTGQRIEDVLHMRWEDVREDGIYIEPEKVEGSSAAKILIAMTPDLKDVINAARALPRKKRGETILCTVRGGRKYAYRTAYDMLTNAAERAGVKDFRPNDFRAKCLTDADLQGLDAQALGGHTTRQMTLRYIRQRMTKKATPPKSIRQPTKILDNSEANA